MSLGGGDQLARGQRSAQFAGGASSISSFEDDLIFRPEIVAEKYGLTEEQIAAYQKDREEHIALPNLPTVEDLKELQASKLFSVTDKRHSYLESAHPLAEESKVVFKPKKFADKSYAPAKPILDRILIKRIPDDPNMELLEDGSMKDKRTGFIIPPQYRQHSNVGVVLAIGEFVVMGGVKTPLSDFIQPGDKVTFGDYNSEVFHMSDERVEKLCDAVQLNFESDPEGLRIVRVQDVRVIEHPLMPEANNG